MTVTIEKPMTVPHKPSAFPGLLLLAALLSVFLFFFYSPNRATSNNLNQEDKTYLTSLYQDTWNYLAAHVDPITNLPYDSSAKQPATSMSNVGFYLAATAMAEKTGLISHDEGMLRTGKTLTSLAKVETWRGFPRPWVLIRSLAPTYGSEFHYGPHLANLIGGLVLAAQTFPEVAPIITELLHRMEFKSLYDPTTGWIKGGYNVEKNDFAIYQPWGRWYYKYFASEMRLLSFYLIAKRVAPAEHWTRLVRPVQEKGGFEFFVSGYEEAGLYTQYLAGLFLDERSTEMGESQKNYAAYQIKFAEEIVAPVWGWSACETPKGVYLSHGELRDEIVAPYASALAAIYFPKKAVANLRKLENLGARPGQEGFRDSFQWKAGVTARNHLTASQAMAFLSLANLLHDGVVWKTFAADPVVARGLRILGFEAPPRLQASEKLADNQRN